MHRRLDGQEKETAVSVFCILFFSLKLYEHYYGVVLSVAVPTACFHSVGMEGINLNFC